MKAGVHGALGQLQWWLGMGLLIAVSIFTYTVFVKPTNLSEPVLPAYACGEPQTYEANNITVRFQAAGAGCDQVESDVPIAVAEAMHTAERQMPRYRLFGLPRPLEIGLYRDLPDGARYQLLGEGGGPRAVALSMETIYADDVSVAYEAAAALALEESAPGLDRAGLERLASSYAALIAPAGEVPISAAVRSQLAVMRRHGIDFVPDLLDSKCRERSCTWSSVLR